MSARTTAEERFEALAHAELGTVEALADAILADGASVQVVEGPLVGAAPVRVPLPGTGGTVVAGRVVLTRCRVEVEGTRGDAIVPGRAPNAALAAAICDAEAERGGPRAGEVEGLAAAAVRRRRERLRADARTVALTTTDGGTA